MLAVHPAAARPPRFACRSDDMSLMQIVLLCPSGTLPIGDLCRAGVIAMRGRRCVRGLSGLRWKRDYPIAVSLTIRRSAFEITVRGIYARKRTPYAIIVYGIARRPLCSAHAVRRRMDYYPCTRRVGRRVIGGRKVDAPPE